MKLEYKLSLWNGLQSNKEPYNKKPLIADVKKAIKDRRYKTEYGTLWYDMLPSGLESITLVKAVNNGLSLNKYEDSYNIVR
jgi:hypothetical protein